MALPWPSSYRRQKYSACSPFSHQWPGHSPLQGGVHDMTTKRGERQPSLYPSLARCRCHALPIAWSCMSPGPSGMLCQSASRSGGAWLEPRNTTNPALTSALCSVTRTTPCSLGTLGARVWSAGSKFKPPAQLLVVAELGKPLGCNRWASCHRSSTSKSVTGTQSLSSSTMWRPGKTKQRAARTKVPAQVGWTRWRPLAWLMGKYTTSHRSWAQHASTAGPPGSNLRPVL